jgi:putative membrane protein
MASGRELFALLAAVAAVFVWSVVNPHDRLTWWMESMPVIIAVPVLLGSRSGFPLTRLAYYLIAFHAVILLLGAHYTYARVPPGNWVQDWLDLSRNHYDRFAHVVQGFVPAILAREILLRLQVLRPGKWLFFLVCCVCLAISALYEIIEWQSAVLGGDSSLDFLGVQGDVWDAQWDMLLALIGSILGQWLLAGVHHRQLSRLEARPMA